jgi:uncharacterized surface anchored protein
MLPLIRVALASSILVLFASAAAAAVVTGTVTDASTHQPLSGMVVAAYDAAGTLRGTATTDATGLYALTLPAGSYRLLSYDNAGVYATTFDGNAESFKSSIARQLTASTMLQLPFALVRGGFIVGTVQKASGLASTSATIEAYNLSGTRRGFTTSTLTGSYTIVLPPGDYKLVAFESSPSLAHEFYRDARSFAEATIVHVAAEQTTQNIHFTLPLAARVSGTAIDADNHTLLPDITVYAYTSAGALVSTTITDANGAFRFTLPPGAWRFVATDAHRTYATGFYATSRSFESSDVVTLFAGDMRADLTIALPRAALIEGHVDAALAMIVAAYNLDGTLHAQTIATPSSGPTPGTYSLAVAPGDYKLVASDAAQHYANEFYRDAFDFFSATNVSVVTSEHRTGIDFTPPIGGRVAGTVRDAAQGQTLAGITVVAYNADGQPVSSAVSGADGRYELVLPPSQFRVIAFDPQLSFAPRYRGTATNYDSARRSCSS